MPRKQIGEDDHGVAVEMARDRVKKVLKTNIPIRHHTTPFRDDCPGLKGSLCQTVFGYEKLVCDTCQKIGLFPEAQQ